MSEVAAQHRLGIGLERLGAQRALDVPLDRARGVGLERRGRPRGARAQSASRTRPSRSEASAGSGPPGAAAPRARAASLAVGARSSSKPAAPSARRSTRCPRRGAKQSRTSSTRASAVGLALVVAAGGSARAGRSARLARRRAVALGVEAILAQASAGPRPLERAALVAARNGSGVAGRGKAPRAARRGRRRGRGGRAGPRLVTVTAPGAGPCAGGPRVGEVVEQLAGRGVERVRGGREALELGERGPQGLRHPRVERFGSGEDGRARRDGAPRTGPALRGQPAIEAGRLLRRGGERSSSCRTKEGWSCSNSARAAAAVVAPSRRRAARGGRPAPLGRACRGCAATRAGRPPAFQPARSAAGRGGRGRATCGRPGASAPSRRRS